MFAVTSQRRLHQVHQGSQSPDSCRSETTRYSSFRTYCSGRGDQLFNRMALHVLNIIVLITAALVGGTVSVGGLSEEMPPNPEVQALIDNVRPAVEERLGHRVPRFILLNYRTQVVAGINYFAKVDIGKQSVVHVRVYRGLDHRVSLSGLQYPKDSDDPITYF